MRCGWGGRGVSMLLGKCRVHAGLRRMRGYKSSWGEGGG